MQFDIHTHSHHSSSLEIVNGGLSIPEHGFFSAGLHPWEISKSSFSDVKEINSLLTHPHCVALGEIGLDRLKGPAMNLQLMIFEQQIALSEHYQLPVIVHCVKSWNEIRACHRSLKPKMPWIFHGFSKASLASEILQEGLFISLGADLLRNKSLREIAPSLPLDQLFFETDTRTETIETIYGTFAKLKNIPLPILEKQVEKQIKKTFPKWTIG